MARTRIAVVGGANTDVAGRSHARLISRDSNPGMVSVSSGGVGRNIAENLALLGVEVSLVTAFGQDDNARRLRSHCVDTGIDITSSLVCEDLPGSVYLAILDDDGDMALALADMRPLERLTPQVLEAALERIGEVDLIVADANIPVESLSWLAEHRPAPVVFDPVSVSKGPRAKQILSGLEAVKCNAMEAEALLGRRSPVRLDAVTLAQELRDAGPSIAVVTTGPSGAGVAWSGGAELISALPVAVANATGAGDAFTAGMAASLALGDRPVDAARFGTAMAAIALSSESTVNGLVSREAVESLLKEDR